MNAPPSGIAALLFIANVLYYSGPAFAGLYPINRRHVRRATASNRTHRPDSRRIPTHFATLSGACTRRSRECLQMGNPYRPTKVLSTDVDDFIGLTQASHATPGRPHTSALWRWCTKGVRTSGGERIRLRHVRIGGKLYTKKVWLEAFWQDLADRSTEHFDAKMAEAERTPPRERRYRPPSAHTRAGRHAEAPDAMYGSEIDRELDREGL